jgi:hypothetical protein
MRTTGLSQHTIEAIRKGKPVRQTTLQRIQAAVGVSLGGLGSPPRRHLFDRGFRQLFHPYPKNRQRD